MLSKINSDTMGYILAIIEYIGALILFISLFSVKNLPKNVRSSIIINMLTLTLIATATIMNRHGDFYIRISSFLYLISSGLFVLSAQVFYRLQPRFILVFVPVVLALGIYLFPDLRDSFVARSRVNTSLNALLCAWAAYLYAYHNENKLVSARLLSAVFALGSLSYLVLFSGSFIQSGAWVAAAYNSIVFKANYFLLLMVILSLAPLMLALVLENHSAKYKKLARIDALTGIRNRRAFFDDADQMLESLCREDGSRNVSVAVIDIDHFKNVNDTFGHAAGDKVIAYLANMMGEVIGDKGVFGRTGGEEFSVFLPDMESAAASRLLERLRTAFEDNASRTIESTRAITLSAGVFAVKAQISKLDDAISKADEALYQAKRMGRNRIERHHAEGAQPDLAKPRLITQ